MEGPFARFVLFAILANTCSSPPSVACTSEPPSPSPSPSPPGLGPSSLPLLQHSIDRKVAYTYMCLAARPHLGSIATLTLPLSALSKQPIAGTAYVCLTNGGGRNTRRLQHALPLLKCVSEVDTASRQLTHCLPCHHGLAITVARTCIQAAVVSCDRVLVPLAMH